MGSLRRFCSRPDTMAESIHFFTSSELSQQLASMSYPAGKNHSRTYPPAGSLVMFSALRRPLFIGKEN